MARTIVTRSDVESATRSARDAEPRGGAIPDGYKDKLLKYIPAETIGAYVALNGLVPSLALGWLASLILFLVCLILTPLYLMVFAGVKKPLQLFISFLAFTVWALAIGGLVDDFLLEPLKMDEQKLRGVASIGLVLFTLIAPLCTPGDAKPTGPS